MSTRSPAPARIPQALLVLVLSLALVGLAWPRLRADLNYLPVDTALHRLWQGQDIEGEQLEALARRGGQALRRHDHYRYHDGLSVLQYLRGSEAESAPGQRREALSLAAAEAAEAVAEAPMKPRIWLRLAAARASLGLDPERVVPALRMSVLTGRVEPTLLPLRLKLLYRYRRSLDGEDRRLLRDQTLLTWRLRPAEVIAGIRDGSLSYQGLAAVLAPSHPGTLAEIDEALDGRVR